MQLSMPTRNRWRSTFLGLLMVVASALDVSAAVFTVNSIVDTGDATPGNGLCMTVGGVCTLRAAIQEANALPGPDTINIGALTITLGSGLPAVTQSLTINGAGQGLTIVDGNNAGSVLRFQLDSGTHTLANLTIQNGNTSLNGGAVYNDATLSVTDVTFDRNRARQGGAIFSQFAFGLNVPSLTLNAVTFTNNASTTVTHGEGGGALFNGSVLLGNNVTFTGNTSLQGGAYYNNSFKSASLTNFVISNNGATYGGGIDNDLGTITLNKGTMVNNVANCCGAGGVSTGGGGIYNNEGSMTLIDVTVSGNQATSPGGYGGGLYNYQTMTLSRVSLADNRAAYGAGAFNGNFDGVPNMLSMNNVTVSGNIGVSSVSPRNDATGAGIYNTTNGQLILTNCTVAANSAVVAGGIENLPSGTNNNVNVRNTILANNIGTVGSADCRGAIGSGGYNIVRTTAGCSFLAASGDETGVDPKLDSLMGSPAYHPLRPDSPAFQTGSNAFCPSPDQRGLARPQGGICDKGAYELGDHVPVVGGTTLQDFNGHNKTDILWRRASGAVAIWLMNGTSAISTASLGTVGTDWMVAGVGDFDGDQKGDILWRHTSGALFMWLNNGATASSTGSLGTVGTDWTIAGVADFDGDGKADILWRNASGSVAMWLMNGTSASATASLGTVGTDWTVAGVGDFDGDHKADILWRHTSGTLAMWLMSGTSAKNNIALGTVDTGWRVAGVGDFNGGGAGDILWRHTSGRLFMWLMNGTGATSTASLGSIEMDWTLAKIGDFNGDGKADILWRHTSGALFMWLMNGATASTTASLGTVSIEWATQ